VQTLIAPHCYRTMSLDAPLRTGDCESVTLGATVGAPHPDYELVMNREALRALIPGLDAR
jgi:hypothetical protein